MLCPLLPHVWIEKTTQKSLYSPLRYHRKLFKAFHAFPALFQCLKQMDCLFKSGIQELQISLDMYNINTQ
jgi:hypothetical protein